MTEVAATQPRPSELTGSPRREVTVVIPTSNRWQLLSRSALPSALGQTEVDHEVVVVDDGSVDDTAHALEELRDPRLRVLRHATPLGVDSTQRAIAGNVAPISSVGGMSMIAATIARRNRLA